MNYKRKRSVKVNPSSCMCKSYKRAGNGKLRRTNKDNASREAADKEIKEPE